MIEMPRYRFSELLLLVLVLAAAGGTRAWYLTTCADHGRTPGPLQVQGHSPRLAYPPGTRFRNQGKPEELDALIENLEKYHWFGDLAPLADKEEKTAHRAPGYPWLVATVGGWLNDSDRLVRWAQVVLGMLTAGCYFFFARRAFRSGLVGFLAGLLCACHPYWIINTAELNDGVLATFLLAAGLALGTRGSQEGGPFTSLLFGLSMAGLSMVRAALLPFYSLAVLWYLLRCRKLKKGWFAALLAFLGFANGLGPLAVRNFQEFGQLVPVADSTCWHLWMGNNPQASGGFIDEPTLRQVLGKKRVGELTSESNQAARYNHLGFEVLEEVAGDPGNTLGRRLWAGLYFVFGEVWFKENRLDLAAAGTMPPWLEETNLGLLHGSLLGLLLLGLLGWRLSYGWRKSGRLAALAAIWVPLPYLLSHAEYLAGPRLPLDGVLISYGAFTLAWLVPGAGRALRKGPSSKDRDKKEDL